MTSGAQSVSGTKPSRMGFRDGAGPPACLPAFFTTTLRTDPNPQASFVPTATLAQWLLRKAVMDKANYIHG